MEIDLPIFVQEMEDGFSMSPQDQKALVEEFNPDVEIIVESSTN